jgi:hypothetical protein
MGHLAGLILALTLAAPQEDAIASAPSAAETFLGLSPGDRIRFPTADKRGTTEGKVVAAGPDALLLTRPGAPEPVRIPWTSLKRLEVHRGRQSSAGRGALFGAVALGLYGASLSVCDSCTRTEAQEHPNLGLVLGAGLGAGLGSLIGAFIRTDRWDEVRLPPIRVSVIPQRRGGMAVALSLRF